MKLIGYLLLFVFCLYMLAHEVFSFIIPQWASAQVVGYDFAKALFIFLFGYGVCYTAKHMPAEYRKLFRSGRTNERV